MKRSEMLKILTNFIEEEYSPRSNEGLNLSLASAVALLDLIEDIGMLPPDYNINQGSGEYSISSCYVNEWEIE